MVVLPIVDGQKYYYFVQSRDWLGNTSAWSASTFSTQDNTAPTISQITPVPSPTNDTTPNYTFSSTEAGTITYGGACASTTSAATVGNNTITFNTLSA